MVKFGKTEIAKEVLWCKKAYKVWNVRVDNIVISKLIKTKLIPSI